MMKTTNHDWLTSRQRTTQHRHTALGAANENCTAEIVSAYMLSQITTERKDVNVNSGFKQSTVYHFKSIC